MRKLSIIFGALLLTMGLPASVGARQAIQVEAVMGDTAIFGIPAAEVPLGPPDFNQPGVNWVGSGTWHIRGLPVTDAVVDRADPTKVLGTLTRSINFDLHLETGTSEAWCYFGMDLGDLGTFLGSCRGSLTEGTAQGQGRNGTVEAQYALAAGGVPGVGPYELTMTIYPTPRPAPAINRHAPRML